MACATGAAFCRVYYAPNNTSLRKILLVVVRCRDCFLNFGDFVINVVYLGFTVTEGVWVRVSVRVEVLVNVGVLVRVLVRVGVAVLVLVVVGVFVVVRVGEFVTVAWRIPPPEKSPPWWV